MKIKFLIIGLFSLLLIWQAVLAAEDPVEKSIRKIFGVPRNPNDSGIDKVILSLDDYMIHYRFFPLGLYTFEEELGVQLSDKIRKFYEKNPGVKGSTLFILGPFQDAYGNMQWKPILSFEFTREIYNKINWGNFVKQDLVRVAQNVTWFRR